MYKKKTSKKEVSSFMGSQLASTSKIKGGKVHAQVDTAIRNNGGGTWNH